MIEQFDMGQSVICDYCGDDYSDSDECGGLLFGSNAACPKCEINIRKNAKTFGEESFIREECKPDQTFKQFVLSLRGGNNTVTTYG